mmetsp:Transcript_17017/g.14475  ORF Transcript_17017/g.14475 Transcript_17017/m.14475 type:complete len:146 (-) Transcript_17017:50-487(-)
MIGISHHILGFSGIPVPFNCTIYPNRPFWVAHSFCDCIFHISNSLTDFAASDMGRLWNCGDLYINVADYSNFDRIHYPDQLIAWMKKWRQASGSDGRIYLTYGDVVERNGQKMLGFVRVFEEFVLINIPASTIIVILAFKFSQPG